VTTICKNWKSVKWYDGIVWNLATITQILLGECMLNFVKYRACLHLSLQNVWGWLTFFWTHCILCCLWKEPVLVWQMFILLPSCLHVPAFYVDQLLRRWRFVICLPMCRWGAASSCWCHERCLVHCTHISASVSKLCSQPGLGPVGLAATHLER